MTVDGNKSIGIDFDGVLHTYDKGWQDGVIYGKTLEGAMQSLVDLTAAGYTLFIFTTRAYYAKDKREQIAKIRVWLVDSLVRESDLTHDQAWLFAEKIIITCEKLPAIAYIDDRGIRFTNWWDIRKLWV